MIASHIRTPLFLAVLALWGCATNPSSTVQTAAPFFQPTSEDSTQLTALASELDTLAMDCAAEGTCEDRVHFARALVSLFENREALIRASDQSSSIESLGGLKCALAATVKHGWPHGIAEPSATSLDGSDGAISP